MIAPEQVATWERLGKGGAGTVGRRLRLIENKDKDERQQVRLTCFRLGLSSLGY